MLQFNPDGYTWAGIGAEVTVTKLTPEHPYKKQRLRLQD